MRKSKDIYKKMKSRKIDIEDVRSPTWVTIDEWLACTCKENYIELDIEFFKEKMLIAPRSQIFLVPFYDLYKCIKDSYYNILRKLTAYLNEKGYVEVDPGNRLSLLYVLKEIIHSKNKER